MSALGGKRFLVVEGPIGVGKTSLARRLAEAFGGETLLEQARDNLFLERFYQDPRRHALATQLFFLFQRSRQLAELRQADLFRPLVVADFLLDKDRLFARLNLDDDEYHLYRQVYQALAPEMPAPDLLICLQAPVAVLKARIQGRGVPYEQAMDEGYLARVSDAYTQFFHHYDAGPLLIVNVEAVDLVNDDRAFALLVEEIRRVDAGRHYFNPPPAP